ncbi:MAG: type I pullulanase, partial [Planctomycetes bacterium]|nr:type I pullulanase [Planctomycetota bacterium]
GADDFGVAFQLDVSLYGKPGERIGLLPRLNGDWQFKDGPDRFWQPSLGNEVYIVQGRPDVYRERPDVRPSLAAATLDGQRLVTVRFSHRLAVTDWPKDRFSIATTEGKPIPVVSVDPVDVREGRTAECALTTAEPLDFVRDTFVAQASGLGTVPVRPWRVLDDAERFYDAQAEMGAGYSVGHTTFHVFAPTARRAWVVTADAPEGDAGRRETQMNRGGKGLWKAAIAGDRAGQYYSYRLEGVGLDDKAEITDIYATCTQNRTVRSLIVDPVKTDPPGFREQSFTFNGSPTDAVIYEMHVRDFTIAGNSGVEHKGKYLGLTEAGTHLPGHPDVRTGLDHLVELGVTHVQLMPIQDFDNDESQSDTYNWGYMPVSFNSPDGWYATSVSGPSRIVEFKRAVKALHDRGLGVVMDVVYNHAADRASFERLVPGYYFRQRSDGSFHNGSGCGNEFMSERPMARKFILDSLNYWVREYRIDGFRFDLMGLIDLQTLKRIKAELSAIRPGILIYGEPWTGGATPLNPITGHPQVRGTGLGAFNDHFRDAIKGDRDGGLPGFVQTGDRIHGIRLGLEGAIHDWSADPLESVNYFEAHDNLTAWDKMLQSLPNAPEADRRKAIRFASLILLTSQGTIFLHAGQEFCRTKQGHNNSYNLPDAINQLDWSDKLRHADVYAYVRGLIAIRKAHPVLRLSRRADIEARSYFLDAPNNHSLMWRLKGEGLPGESAREFLVLLNGSAQAGGFVLPAKGWRILADADRAGTTAIGQIDEAVEVPARSGMLLMRQ